MLQGVGSTRMKCTQDYFCTSSVLPETRWYQRPWNVQKLLKQGKCMVRSNNRVFRTRAKCTSIKRNPNLVILEQIPPISSLPPLPRLPSVLLFFLHTSYFFSLNLLSFWLAYFSFLPSYLLFCLLIFARYLEGYSPTVKFTVYRETSPTQRQRQHSMLQNTGAVGMHRNWEHGS